jgi:hypothetical protein
MEKFTSTGRFVREKVLISHTDHEDRNTLYVHTVWRMEPNWIGHSLRENYLVNHVTEGKIQRREDEEQDVSSYYVCLIVSDVETSTVWLFMVELGCWATGKEWEFPKIQH